MTDRNRTRLARTLAATALAAALGLTAAPLAQAAGRPAADQPAVDQSAATGPVAVPAGELAAARSAAQTPSVLDQLGHFFARGGVPPTRPLAISPAEEARSAALAAPRLSGDTVAVYTLDPGFVAGTPGAPVARPDFTASKAVSADGRTASVWTVRQGTGWKVVNIASGSDETDYAARAAGTGGGTAFREPQLNAWYVLRGGRVLPLDDEARRSVGAGGVSLAGYQRLVHQRYGDKLPGSAYDRAGLGGGFQLDAAPAPAADRTPLLLGGGALGATVLTGGGLLLRRRRA